MTRHLPRRRLPVRYHPCRACGAPRNEPCRRGLLARFATWVGWASPWCRVRRSDLGARPLHRAGVTS